MFPDQFWISSIWKEAARAGLRQISRMVSAGNIEGASQLAKTPGVLKPSRAGSEIKAITKSYTPEMRTQGPRMGQAYSGIPSAQPKQPVNYQTAHLGRGGEGLATLVAHPEHGVAVRKLYDPRGVSGPEMIARKEQTGRALNNNPTFARFMGADQTPFGGQMHFNEYIKPGQAPTGNAGLNSIRKTEIEANQGLSNLGYSGSKDIHPGNMIYDANMKQHRMIDYIPGREGEFIDTGRQDHLMPAQGSGPLNPNYSTSSEETGGMLGRLLGGRSRAGGLRNADQMSTTIPSIQSTQATFAQGTPKPVQNTQAIPSTPPVGTSTAVLKKPTVPSTTPLAPSTVKLKRPDVTMKL